MTATAGEPEGGSQTVQAGRVGRAHGLDGSFYVTGARARLLALGTVVAFDGRETAIVRRAGTDEHPIVRLHGIDGRGAAEALRGLELTVKRADAPALEEGEWWAGELEGCVVVDGERVVGVVARLMELPSCEALEVRVGQTEGSDGTGGSHGSGAGGARGGHSGEILIPMVRDAIRRVDVAGGRIDVDMSFIEEA